MLENFTAPHSDLRLTLAQESDAPAVRALVNQAYRELADVGLNYTATYQDEQVTLKRMQEGRVFLLHKGPELVGTILFKEQNFFTGRKTAYVGQLGIRPQHKKSGYGTLLMDFCERLAKQENFDGIQLDTAKPAAHLVSWYLQRRYNIIGEQQWEGKTYASWIFEKDLR